MSQLIAGFEDPYGMELLSSLLWVAKENLYAAADAATATDRLFAWNERKRAIFRPEHVHKAWARLKQAGWLDSFPVEGIIDPTPGFTSGGCGRTDS